MSPARRKRGMEFPDRLRKARDLRGWNQAELADKARFQPSAISRFESGASRPSFENLRRLAGALRVSTDYLLGLVEDPVGTAPAGGSSQRLYRKLQELTDEQQQFAEKLIEELSEMGKKK